MRRWILLAALILLQIIPAASASARDVLQGTDCTIPADQTVTGNLYSLCRTLIIDGVVNGDVVAGAVSARISGTVHGSVYVTAGRLTLTGTVDDDIHFVGGGLNLMPPAATTSASSSLYSAALTTVIGQAFDGDIAAAGYQLLVDAPVNGNIDFAGSALRISAPVTGNVTASLGGRESQGVSELQSLLQIVASNVELIPPGLYVTGTGSISGTLTYSAPAPGVIVGPVGEISYQPVILETDAVTSQEDFGSALGAYVRQVIREFATLFLIGAVLLVLAPRAIQAPVYTVRHRAVTSIGLGLIAFILSFPVALIAVVISIGIVLLVSLLGIDQITLLTALILIIITLAGVALFYFVALFISRVVIALALGRVLLRGLYPGRGRLIDRLLHLAVGALTLAILTSMPYIGTLTTVIAAFWGLGAIIVHARSGRPEPRPSPSTAPDMTDDAPPALPPPSAGQAGPGTDHLPDGFNWWR